MQNPEHADGVSPKKNPEVETKYLAGVRNNATRHVNRSLERFPQHLAWGTCTRRPAALFVTDREDNFPLFVMSDIFSRRQKKNHISRNRNLMELITTTESGICSYFLVPKYEVILDL